MISVCVQDEDNDKKETVVNTPKKRGRKSKKEIENALNESLTEKIEVSIPEPVIVETTIVEQGIENDNDDSEQKKTTAKKRGRKPKGGKIIHQTATINDLNDSRPNVILHLKCSSKDLINNISSTDTLEIESYNFSSKHELSYDVINQQTSQSTASSNSNNNNININNAIILQDPAINANESDSTPLTKTKEIWNKLKQLEHDLHINNSSGKRSACFWCTFDFDNPPVFIPKHFIKNSYHVYGCFCSPECAVAHLMNENIDSSTRFERYHFINQIYGKIYNCEKNIKPAPNPFYMLEKYYGNLTIQEYRSLLRNERLFLIVDKPLTRILPELHEDNDEFILNNKIIPSNTYQIKKKIQKKGQTKNTSMNEHFGINA